jgi:Flp pilus assembly protein TadG
MAGDFNHSPSRRFFWRGRGRRRGAVLIGYCILMTALIGIASLAVDLGHVELVKTQLQTAADAAALAGAAALAAGDSPTQIASACNSAVQTAALNSIDNQPVVLLGTDVQVGNWDTTQTPSFSVSRSPGNAVRITACRQASRGTAVALTLAATIGVKSCDTSATAIAAVRSPMSSYGIVGISHVNFSSLGVLARIQGDVVSDGDINIGNPLGLLVSVTGNAQSFSGYVSHGGLAQIAGSTAGLQSALNFPPVVLPASNNNTNISSYLDSQNNFIAIGLATIPAGTYVVHDLNILADVDLNLQGPVTFYVTGAFNLAASVNLLGNTNDSPSNFNVNVLQGGTVNFLANILVPIEMNLYAPQSAINIAVGVNNYTGELIGQKLDIALPVLGSFTEVKPKQTAQGVSLVQ